jgi:tetratricopeptide (TPR) repeat protein
MAQGRFAEAEEQFEVYRYIAPDQPNPHDSLGELLLLLGRWREAKKELEEALRIKPDFCASWRNRVQVAVLERDYDDAEAVIARAEEARGCEPAELGRLRCQARTWKAFDAGDWEATWAAAQAPECGDFAPGEVLVISHLAALRAGRRAEALALEARVADLTEKYAEKGGTALGHHLAGNRLLADGQAAEAVARLREADAALAYWTGEGYLKLANRLALADALEVSGRPDEAAKLLAEVRAVNEPLAERWGAPPAGGGAPG